MIRGKRANYAKFPITFPLTSIDAGSILFCLQFIDNFVYSSCVQNYHIHFKPTNLIVSPMRFASIEQLVLWQSKNIECSSELNEHRDDTYHFHIELCRFFLSMLIY